MGHNVGLIWNHFMKGHKPLKHQALKVYTNLLISLKECKKINTIFRNLYQAKMLKMPLN
ncbi:Uncharacterised protein [Chlamydia trachomatis]|nr:Uncharacterised protein [Chlamydia trachomatis]